MRGVKIAITFMTLAIFVCLGLLIYGMTNPNMFKKNKDLGAPITLSQMQQTQTQPTKTSIPVMSSADLTYPASITLPANHTITKMTADNGKIYFLLQDKSQQQSLYIWSEDGSIAQHIQVNN